MCFDKKKLYFFYKIQQFLKSRQRWAFCEKHASKINFVLVKKMILSLQNSIISHHLIFLVSLHSWVHTWKNLWKWERWGKVGEVWCSSKIWQRFLFYIFIFTTAATINNVIWISFKNKTENSEETHFFSKWRIWRDMYLFWGPCIYPKKLFQLHISAFYA